MTVTVYPSHIPMPLPIDDVCFGLVCGKPPTWVYPSGVAVLFACDDHAQMLRDGALKVEHGGDYCACAQPAFQSSFPSGPPGAKSRMVCINCGRPSAGVLTVPDQIVQVEVDPRGLGWVAQRRGRHRKSGRL